MNARPTTRTFDWRIRRDAWPPPARPTVPVGPTLLEVIRSCPLRGCFEASEGYERRMSFDGRVGNAFHRVLQSLHEEPLVGADRDVAAAVKQRFEQAVHEQTLLADRIPREQAIPRGGEREGWAAEALIGIAQALNRAGRTAPPPLPKRREEGQRRPDVHGVPLPEPPWVPDVAEGDVYVEVPVWTANGLLRGRVDHVERTEGKLTITDYKSAFRTDLPGRYERQVQLYALMWARASGEWPAAGRVVYPLTGKRFDVDVTPARCQEVYEESAALIGGVQAASDPATLATPGDTCKVCDFRPWCQSYWAWQTRPLPPTQAAEWARWGLEGRVTSVETRAGYLKVGLAWRDREAEIVVPAERFPQLRSVAVGAVVRVLDARWGGMLNRPRARVSEWTEVFVVERDDEP